LLIEVQYARACRRCLHRRIARGFSANSDVAFSMFHDDALAYRTFAVRDNAGNVLQFFGK